MPNFLNGDFGFLEARDFSRGWFTKGISFELQRFAQYGTSGNDSIYSCGSDRALYGYGGNDSISNYSAWYTTVEAGDGNDTIISGTGEGYNGKNTIISGAITLSGASGKTINIVGTKMPTPSVTQQDVIKRFTTYLDSTSYSGIDAVDAAIKYVFNGYFQSAMPL